MELSCNPRVFLPNPLLPLTGIRPALLSEASPSLLWLPPLYLLRAFPSNALLNGILSWNQLSGELELTGNLSGSERIIDCEHLLLIHIKVHVLTCIVK